MSRKETADRLREIRSNEGAAVRSRTAHTARIVHEEIAAFPEFEELRQEARGIKEDAIERLPTLIDEVKEAVTDNGGTVFVADSAEAARAYVADLATERDAQTVVKSKSMTTEEIELNEAIQETGADVIETDLGELVVQVAGDTPSHLVGPAYHRTPAEIAELFTERLDPPEPLPPDPQALTAFARDYVGRWINRSDIGVTGANFIVAESGTIALVTNEGNARKSALVPNTHVAVAGIEKLIPTMTDLAPFAELIARSATGQQLPSYLSLLTPPTDSPTIDFGDSETPISTEGDREFHLVLVNNGRRDLRADEQLRETLYCIRCGACANTCANFQSVGGHAFGGKTYTGGIGTGWEYGVHGPESASGMNDLCTGCGRCTTQCPVDIDIPWINTVVRDRLNRDADPSRFEFLVDGLRPDEEPGGLDLQKRIFGNIDTLAALGSTTPRLSNAIAQSGLARRLLERAVGIDRRRSLPSFGRSTLTDWAADREAPSRTAEPVVLYPDLYTEYFLPKRGRAAVRTLEALGYDVRVPTVPESGRAPLSQGMVDTARSNAEAVTEALEPYIQRDLDVLVIEPSDYAIMQVEYERLVDEPAFERLRRGTHEVTDFLAEQIPGGEELTAPPDRVHYHGHCQARSYDFGSGAIAILEALGSEVTTSTVECCGMAGSFGYKTEYYETSMDVGDQLAGEIDEAHVVASGASCAEQLRAYGYEARHPVELLDPGD